MNLLPRLLLAGALTLSQTAMASLEIQPGLWKVSMKIRSEGQTIDPGKEIKKAMRELPQEEQVQLQETLEEVAGMDEKGRVDVCYDAAHFKQIETTTVFNDQECISQVVKRSNSRVISEFLCVDGTSGKTTWIVHNKKKYTGVVKVTSGDGEESELIYEGKFDRPVCEELEAEVVI
jgi:hypothetical protein